MKRIITLFIFFMLVSSSVALAEYASGEDVEAKAAEDFEKLVFTSGPNSKNLISFFDVQIVLDT